MKSKKAKSKKKNPSGAAAAKPAAPIANPVVAAAPATVAKPVAAAAPVAAASVKPVAAAAPAAPAKRKPTQEEISSRAHQMWIDEGRPTGRSLEHWFRAERELSSAPKA